MTRAGGGQPAPRPRRSNKPLPFGLPFWPRCAAIQSEQPWPPGSQCVIPSGECSLCVTRKRILQCYTLSMMHSAPLTLHPPEATTAAVPIVPMASPPTGGAPPPLPGIVPRGGGDEARLLCCPLAKSPSSRSRLRGGGQRGRGFPCPQWWPSPRFSWRAGFEKLGASLRSSLAAEPAAAHLVATRG